MSSGPTFVLVPGAGGDGWYWHRVAPLLSDHGHDVVVVDLPTGDPAAGLAAYADAIVAAAVDAGTGPDGVVLVGQSMGAFSAPLTVDRLDVRSIVLVNAMIPSPGETAGDWWGAVGQPEARAEAEREQGRDPDADFDPLVGFFHDVPDVVREEAFARGAPAQAARPFGEPWPLDRWPDVPTSGIAGRDDRLFPVDLQRRVARERLGLDLTVVPGGHLLALADPDGLAAAILG